MPSCNLGIKTHDYLRVKAFKEKTTITRLIHEALRNTYKDCPTEKRLSKADLLAIVKQVAGKK